MIVVVGLSHKTASIEVRERVALSSESAEAALGELHQLDMVAEALLLSTCNRVEVVLSTQGEEPNAEALQETAIQVLEKRAPGVRDHLYRYAERDAIEHLFRVASSLDSLVLGEPQILGQVKAAFELAKKHGTLGAELHRVVTRAIRAAKRVRTETTIGSGQVSVPSVAADLATQIFGELTGKTIVLVGSGDMGEGVAKLLKGAGCRLLVVGRTPEKVTALASRMGGEPRTFADLDQALAEADVVVTTTSAPDYVVPLDAVQRTHKRRRGRNLFLIDLAVPRDVDPRIGDVDGVFLYNIDDLSQVVAESLSLRQREAEQAAEIVQQEVERFEKMASAETVTPTVVALRRTVRGVFDMELDRSLKGRLRHLSGDDREALERLFDAALNKLFHEPTRRLRQLASEQPRAPELEITVDALRQVFGIDEVDSIEDSGIVDQLGNQEPAASEDEANSAAAEASEGKSRSAG